MPSVRRVSIGSHIELFAGVGMASIPLNRLGFETIATAETDPFCRSVLKARHPRATHHKDVRHIYASTLALHSGAQRPLIISGGFPCPPISSAGYGGGIEKSLWPEFARIIRDFMPEYVLIENVALLRKRGLKRVLCDLATCGYDARWDCIPAAAVGAPHLRDRIFIVASKSAGTFNFHPGGIEIGRAGRMVSGYVYGAAPAAPIKEVNASLRRYGSVLPGFTPSSTCHVKLYPTVTRQDGVGGPGRSPKRQGGLNLRTMINERYGSSLINPRFAEWMMGLPYGWTNPNVTNDQMIPFAGWRDECQNVLCYQREPMRRERIRACGNGVVPQAVAAALAMLFELSPAGLEGATV